MAKKYASPTLDPKHCCTPSLFLRSEEKQKIVGSRNSSGSSADSGFHATTTCHRCIVDFHEGFVDNCGKPYRYLRVANPTFDELFAIADRYRENSWLSPKDANRIIDELIVRSDLPEDYLREKFVLTYSDDSYSKENQDRNDETNRHYFLLKKRLGRMPKSTYVYNDANDFETRKRYVEELLHLLPIVLRLETSVKSKLLDDEFDELKNIVNSCRIVGFCFYATGLDLLPHERWIKTALRDHDPNLTLRDETLNSFFRTADHFAQHGCITLDMAVNLFVRTTNRVTRCSALSKIRIDLGESEDARSNERARSILEACFISLILDVNTSYEDFRINPSRMHSEALIPIWRCIKTYDLLDTIRLAIKISDNRWDDRCVKESTIVLFDRLSVLRDVDARTLNLIREFFLGLSRSDLSLSHLMFPLSFFIDARTLREACLHLIHYMNVTAVTFKKTVSRVKLIQISDMINVMTSLRNIKCIEESVIKIDVKRSIFYPASPPPPPKSIKNRFREALRYDERGIRAYYESVKINAENLLKHFLDSRYPTYSEITVNHDRCKILTSSIDGASTTIKNPVPRYPRDEAVIKLLRSRYAFIARHVEVVVRECIGRRSNTTVACTRRQICIGNPNEFQNFARIVSFDRWSKEGITVDLLRSNEFLETIGSLIVRCKTL